MMNDLAYPVNPKHVTSLVSKAALGMELARSLTAFAVVCGSGCECAVKAGKHFSDTDGVVYVTVKVERLVCKTHQAYTSPLFAGEILFRLSINDAHETSAVIQINPESAAILLPRLYEVDLNDLQRCVYADCMM